MADLAELEATKADTQGEPEAEEWGAVDDDEQIMIDMKEAILLLKSAKILIDYLSDPILKPTISKRERAIMDKLSENVRTYLAATVPTYTEDVEEGL